MIKALRKAAPHTIPVFFGYLFLGIGFGVLLIGSGLDWYWAPIMCLTIYAGSLQYVAVGTLFTVFSPLNAIMLTLAISARQFFYGISLLGKFKNMGFRKPYAIFALTDETYSLLVGIEPPDGVDANWFYFWISALNHSYWIFGSTLGALFSAFINFNTKGVDFAMTALFLYIFLSQWESQPDHSAALIGVISGIVCLFIFGSGNFIIPSMIAITAGLLLARGRIEKNAQQERKP